jgi:REP element-mobilizing transposase RayT
LKQIKDYLTSTYQECEEVDTSNKTEIKTKDPFFPIQAEDGRESLDLNKDVLLEPVYPDAYNLSYTCLLIPRFPSHQLVGDLADYLPQWLQQVCVSYGGRLEFITVEPDYFQWALSVLPSVSPGQFMQQIRDDISKMIFSNFGRIKRENLSNDFWAPGYLVVLGIRPHPVEMVKQYIRLTRRQQGLHKL